ncbi:MAG: hypothetical protein QM762_07785 [Chryseolinea sp.]
MNDFRFAVKLTIGLVVVGTVILLLFVFTLDSFVGIIGYIFTVMSILVGLLFLVILAVRVATKKTDGLTAVKAVLVMIINIPVALCYAYIVVVLLNIARITFENTTGSDLTSIRISGCEERVTSSLKNGDTTTVWIDIPSDCEVVIDYEINGEVKREVVASYLTTMNGLIGRYKIGSNEDILL